MTGEPTRNKRSHIKRSYIDEILRQNEAMRRLLLEWPARAVMMEWEKEWDRQRGEFLTQSPPPTQALDAPDAGSAPDADGASDAVAHG